MSLILQVSDPIDEDPTAVSQAGHSGVIHNTGSSMQGYQADLPVEEESGMFALLHGS